MDRWFDAGIAARGVNKKDVAAVAAVLADCWARQLVQDEPPEQVLRVLIDAGVEFERVGNASCCGGAEIGVRLPASAAAQLRQRLPAAMADRAVKLATGRWLVYPSYRIAFRPEEYRRLRELGKPDERLVARARVLQKLDVVVARAARRM